MRWIFLSLCFICSLQADPSKKICLNMIVKNESAVIRRSLTSAKPLIDYWVIVDTGSTDGTQEIIREVMKGIPGELHERPWVNFEVNRNQALELAKEKGDYLLFIDADEEFVISDPKAYAKLDQDCYLMKVHEQIDNSIDYTRALLVSSRLPWRWEGVLHELLECPSHPPSYLLEGIKVVSRSAEGARAKDPKKYLNDAAVLEEALKKDPNNSRYTFYLAQSYLNAQEYAKSLKNYQKRAKMGGFDEEVFISLYVSGHLQEKLGLLSELFIDSYWKAYHARPTRADRARSKSCDARNAQGHARCKCQAPRTAGRHAPEARGNGEGRAEYQDSQQALVAPAPAACGEMSRHSPGARSSAVKSPKRLRCSRTTGQPWLANMRFT